MMTDDERAELVAGVVRVAADADLRGLTAAADRDGRFAWDVWEVVRDLGMPGLDVPREEGGLGADLRTVTAVLEELGRHSIAASTSVFTFSGFGAHLFNALPKGHDLREHLSGIADGTVRTALGLTEASGGSDLSTMKTRLRNSEGGWRLTGTKLYTTLAKQATHLVVGALVDHEPNTADGSDAGRWVDRFVIAVLPADADGVNARRIPMQALRSCPTYEVVLDDALVPSGWIVEPTLALKALLSVLNEERLSVAAQSCGLARRALELVWRYASDRVVFGSPLSEKQAVAHPAVEVWERLTMARLLVRRATTTTEGEQAGVLATMAQRAAARVAHDAADLAVQVHGGGGLATEAEPQRLWRDTRLHLIGPVAREASADFLARRLSLEAVDLLDP